MPQSAGEQCLTLLVVKESHTITFPSWRKRVKEFNKLVVTLGRWWGEAEVQTVTLLDARGWGWAGGGLGGEWELSV